MTTILKRAGLCVAIVSLVLCSCRASTDPVDKGTKAVRTDVVDKTVLALKSSFLKTVRHCDEACREERNAKLSTFELDDRAISDEAIEMVKRLMAAKDINLEIVNAWIDRAGDIQRNYFNSVFQYHKGGATKDALFYLDIGEPHKAAEELRVNQQTLTQIVADCSTLFEVAQAGRSGIAFRLLNQLTDLTPYHNTFGCMQRCSLSGNCTTEGDDEEAACATIMRTTFEASFIQLQETLSKFFTTEISEDDLLNQQ